MQNRVAFCSDKQVMQFTLMGVAISPNCNALQQEINS